MVKKNKIAVVLAALMLFSVMAPVLAATIEDKQAELQNIQEQLENKAYERENAKAVVVSATDKLIEAQNQLSIAQNDVAVVIVQRDDLQDQIDNNQAAIEAKKAVLEQRLKIYRKRLRDIYINGQINYLDVLLGAKDFSDFSSRMYLLQKIIQKDVELIEDIKQQKQEIEQRTLALEADIAAVKALYVDLKNKQDIVAQKTIEREAYYNEALAEENRLIEEYNALMVASENVTEMIRNMELAGTMTSGGGSGVFIWPIQGEITSYYGWRTHPIFGTEKYHSGMDIAADYGDPILAADSGTIIYADWMEGYGYAVMIDHGAGLVTLYGHNNDLCVSAGQSVAQGQLIAHAGSTGYSTGPHCHFEVRLHGEVTEPLNYLP